MWLHDCGVMQLYHSRPPTPIHLSAQRRYTQGQLEDKIHKLHRPHRPIWLGLKCNQYIQLDALEIPIVCQIVAHEHDEMVGTDIPYDDWWDSETQLMEASALDFVNNTGASDDDDGWSSTD